MEKRALICRVLNYVDQNLGSRMILEELAGISGYSVPQFSRVFTELSGITPMRYVHTARILKAAELLSEGEKSITEIAFFCGFESLEVFERGFKKYYGVSASAYRSGSRPAPSPFYLSERIYYERLRNMSIDNGNRFDWGRTAEMYAKSRNLYPPEFWETLHSLGVGKPEQKILDIGTGTGILPMNMKRYGGKYTGVDLSAEMIGQAETMVPDVNFICADAQRLPFKNESFHVITALQCWVYFDKSILLPELRRVLKKNGNLYVMFLTWLPDEDELIRKSFAVIKQFNPNWSSFMKRVDQVDPKNWRKGGFSVEQTVKRDFQIPFTKESWCDRLTASRAVGATLSDEKIAEFRNALTDMLDREAENQFTLLHEAVILKLKTD